MAAKDIDMNDYSNNFRYMTWSLALILSGIVSGCGSGGSGSGAATPVAAVSSAAAAAAAAGRTLTVAPGAGTGAGTGGKGPAPVVLGGAGNYVILAETGISTVPTSAVTGDLGISAGFAVAITGFGALPLDVTACFSTSPQVTGKVFAADYNTLGCTTPALLTTAITNMTTAYTDAAGRAPDYTELGAGAIGGLTLPPGVYKWATGVSILTDVFLAGGANDVWIFEVAQDITMANAAKVTLLGGALPKNIFWQVGGGTGVAIGTTAHFEGVILAAKAITVATGASVNGRLLAQSAVTLQSNVIVQPAP
jgi:hypothetical protein